MDLGEDEAKFREAVRTISSQSGDIEAEGVAAPPTVPASEGPALDEAQAEISRLRGELAAQAQEEEKAKVAELVAMGFAEQPAVTALEASDGDVVQAEAQLFNQGDAERGVGALDAISAKARPTPANVKATGKPRSNAANAAMNMAKGRRETINSTT